MEQAKSIHVKDSFTFCFVGRLVGDKGVNELVKAFDRLSREYAHVRLLLVGDAEEILDPLSPESKIIIKQNDRIVTVGQQQDVRPFMAASDALVFPSYREGFPNVVLEAGAMGLPSIVTDINGCNEIILPGENGEIIRPREVKALYEKMKEWVDQPEKVSRMAGNARKLVESRFEQQMVWKALLEVYEKLIN